MYLSISLLTNVIFLNLTFIKSFVIIMMFIDRYSLSITSKGAMIFTLYNNEMFINGIIMEKWRT